MPKNQDTAQENTIEENVEVTAETQDSLNTVTPDVSDVELAAEVNPVDVTPATVDQFKTVEFVDTPYTFEVVVGSGVYVQPLNPTDTYDVRTGIPFTTEPVVEITEDGFKTTDTQFIRVTS